MAEGIDLIEYLATNDITAKSVTTTGDIGLLELGDATMWDDLRVSPNALPLIGANSPTHIIVGNDGTTTTGSAMEFDGNNDYGAVAYFAGMDTADLTIAMWVNSDTTTSNELLDRDVSNGFEFYMSGGNLIFAPGSGGNVQSNGGLIAGATQLLIATVRTEGSNIRCKLYIDGQPAGEEVLNGALATGSGGYKVAEYVGGGWNYDGKMDNLQTYNLFLTDAQIAELYNNGAGTNALPTGIVAADDLIMYFQDTVVNQSTMAGATDFVNNGGTLVDGLIGITSGSFGVAALSFAPNVRTEIFFTAQMPHTYKIGTDIIPHVHMSVKDNDTGNIVWGLEYMWKNIGEQQPTVTTMTSNAQVAPSPGYHTLHNLPTLDGTGKNISSMLVCRMYRDGYDVNDTFAHQVLLSEFDFHFEIDSDGSREITSKV